MNTKKFEKLEKIANSIPSMGGRTIAEDLRYYAGITLPDTDIVEVGTWLGSGTAQVCLGLIQADKTRTIHCYDHFVAKKTQIGKAKKENVKIKGDTLKLTQCYLKPFGMPIKYHKGDYRKMKYEGRPISLYIDDASKREAGFNFIRKEFFPKLIDGAIVILMDYYYYEKKEGDEGLRYQSQIMPEDKRFKFIKRIAQTSAAIYQYRSEIV